MALYCPCNSREKYFSMKDHAFRSVVMAARSRDTSASISFQSFHSCLLMLAPSMTVGESRDVYPPADTAVVLLLVALIKHFGLPARPGCFARNPIALRFKFGFKRRAFALCDDFTEFLSMTHDCSLLILSSQRCVVRRLALAKSAMASGEASGLRAKAARIAGSLLVN